MTGAGARWRADLESWAIPAHILEQAPESPFGFPVAIFGRAADRPPESTPSREAALEGLGSGGSVVDVGCGAGAASLALAAVANHITGVDESPDMLEAFSSRARDRGIDHAVVRGRWPDVEAACATADVVVCHHVLYNVPDIDEFLMALHGRARRRVVVELTAAHPLAWMNPLWRDLHGVDRPERPRARDALEVASELGLTPTFAEFELPSAAGPGPDLADMVRRRLCLPVARHEDVVRSLRDNPPPPVRRLATIWWDVEGSAKP